MPAEQRRRVVVGIFSVGRSLWIIVGSALSIAPHLFQPPLVRRLVTARPVIVGSESARVAQRAMLFGAQ